MRPLRIYEPVHVDEAVQLRKDLGEEASYYAGGTELLLAMKQGFLDYAYLINLKTIPGLDRISLEEDGGLYLGALSTHRQIESSPLVRRHFPEIAQMASRVANPRVRNTGTIGGNLCFAEPHSDPATLFLVYGGEVEVAGSGGRRTVPLDQLPAGPYDSGLEPGDLLLGVRLDPLPAGSRLCYMKWSFLERPTVGVGACLVRDGRGDVVEARLAVGSVGPVPQRCGQAEGILAGVSAAGLHEAALAAAETAAREVDVIADMHGSEDYKRHLVQTLVLRALGRIGPGAGEGTA